MPSLLDIFAWLLTSLRPVVVVNEGGGGAHWWPQPLAVAFAAAVAATVAVKSMNKTAEHNNDALEHQREALAAQLDAARERQADEFKEQRRATQRDELRTTLVAALTSAREATGLLSGAWAVMAVKGEYLAPNQESRLGALSRAVMDRQSELRLVLHPLDDLNHVYGELVSVIGDGAAACLPPFRKETPIETAVDVHEHHSAALDLERRFVSLARKRLGGTLDEFVPV